MIRNLKIIGQFFLVASSLLGCAGKSNVQVAEVSKADVNWKDLDRAVQLQDAIGDKVWSGFSKFRTSVVFITREDQYLLNPLGAVPAEYHVTDLRGPSWSAKIYKTSDWHAPDGSPFSKEEIETAYLANAFSSAQTEHHFPYSVFFLDSVERFHDKGMKWSIDDWSAIFWHEVFHNFQDTLYSPELVVANVTDFSHLKVHVKSEKFLDKIRKEQRIVMRALKTSDLAAKRKLVCGDFINARKHRYRSMTKDAVVSERFYEISEGTARYTEELMSVQAGKFFLNAAEHERFKSEGFEFFAKYADRNPATYYEKLDEMSPSMRYFYNTGFGLALVLDQVDPQWKKTAFQTRGFLFAKIEEWCRDRN